MSLASEIRVVVQDVLADETEHKIDDIKRELSSRGINLPPDSAALRAVLSQMKKKRIIKSTGVGIYQLISATAESVVSTYQLEELELVEQRFERTIQELSTFNWIKCSDTDLKSARKKAALIKSIGEKANNFTS